MISQAAILCGGLGTRLGVLTAQTPKPLLPVDGVPFLDTLLFELGRHGIRRILLLGGFGAAAIERYADATPLKDRFGLEITVSTEPSPAGTGGALWHARQHLDDAFYLLNGDSWFDINLLDVGNALLRNPSAVAVIAVREMRDASRFGTVEFAAPPSVGHSAPILRFADRPTQPGPGLVSGGVYACRRDLLAKIVSPCSLETEIWPVLAADQSLLGVRLGGYFIDIGVPNAYADAQQEIPICRHRPAAFIDGNLVLADGGNPFRWSPAAPAAIKLLNDAGLFVFLMNNQTGVGGDFYAELASLGAHIDDIIDCPWLRSALDAGSRRASDSENPVPGGMPGWTATWPVDLSLSFLIATRNSERAATAISSTVPCHFYCGGDLVEFISEILATRQHARK